MKDLAQRNEQLRLQRFLRNWSLKDLADELGTTVTTVQRWERGSQQPSAYYRVKLCALFGLNPQELGLEEEALPPTPINIIEAETSIVASSREVALWTVPYARNPHFTGRNDLLNQLEQRLSSPDTSQANTLRQIALTQAQAITGLGGIGKTQIAVEYAYRALAQGRYVHTIWITATSEEAILTSFTALADQLPALSSRGETDQHKIVVAVIDWLERCEQPWLLTFDDVDDLSFIPLYLPRRGNGNILLTTRTSAVGSFTSSLEVETMEVLEGIQLLLRRAQHFATASDEEIDEAGNLVVALAQFPLALDQAGAYIEETGCSVHDYLELYRQHRHALLARRGMQVIGYPESVATTWSLSFEQIEQVNPAATDLLRLCTFLSPDHIPEELLIEGAPYWPSALQEAVTDPLRFNQMIEALLRFSLVKRHAGDHMLSIHRLVQVIQMETMEREEQRQWAERLVCAVNTIFPADSANHTNAWSQCQRHLEQVQACDTQIQQYQLLLPEAAEVLERAATYLRECALYTLAEPLYQRAQCIWERLVGPEHPLVAQLLNNLAHLYQKQGKYERAEKFYRRALLIREQQSGSEHPDIAVSLNGLASLYWQQGLYEQAEQLYQRALLICEQQFGPEHPNVTYPLHGLALLYSQQEKYERAEMLYQRALRIREQQLGPEHNETADVLHDFASFQQTQGHFSEATSLYHHALTIREHVLGTDHPMTVKTRKDLMEVR